MKKITGFLFKHPYWSCLIIIVAIAVVDSLVGRNRLTDYPYWGDVITYNGIMDNVWFAEALGLVATSLLLFGVFRSRVRLSWLPLFMAAGFALVFSAYHIGTDTCRITSDRCIASSWNETLHHSILEYETYDSHDWSLESIHWRFIEYQIPFVSGGIAGYALQRVLRADRKRTKLND